MDTISVGIREFRAGLAEYIEQRKPVAITRHGVTVGVFVPTPRPSSGDVQALRDASARLQAAMPLSEEDVDAAVADFVDLRKVARRKKAPARSRAARG